MRSRFAPIGSFSAATRNVGALPAGAALQVAAHRHALRVAGLGEVARLRVVGVEVVAAEEAHDHPRAGRAVGLLALHRVPQRLARVLGRPHGGIAGGHVLPRVTRLAQALPASPSTRAPSDRGSAPGSASCRRSCPPRCAASELWTSVLPTMPNLNGLTPSFASCSRPRLQPLAQVIGRHHRPWSAARPRASGCRTPSRRCRSRRTRRCGESHRVRLGRALGLHRFPAARSQRARRSA